MALLTRQTGGPTVTSLLPQPASVILLCKSINLTTEPGPSTILFIEQSWEAKLAYCNNEHAHTTSDRGSQDFSELWREQTHRWNFKHSLYFSSSDMLRKENKYHRRLQSTSHLQCTELISLCYSPKVFPFFLLATFSPQSEATWKRTRSAQKMASSLQFMSISLALACLQRDQFPNSEGQHCQKWII